jgi:hypothetical protein
MATLRIDTLYQGGWKLFGFQHAQLLADRDRYVAKLERRLGRDMAEDIQRHVEASLGRLLPIPDFRKPEIMVMREFAELRAIEDSIEEIERRIEVNAVFFDPNREVLGTLGLCWRQDVLRLVDGKQSPGYMSLKNVRKFLSMVTSATQRFKGDDASDPDVANFYRKWRREFVQFLQRAAQVGEPLYCVV